jgi:hypothetical protein
MPHASSPTRSRTCCRCADVVGRGGGPLFSLILSFGEYIYYWYWLVSTTRGAMLKVHDACMNKVADKFVPLYSHID